MLDALIPQPGTFRGNQGLRLWAEKELERRLAQVKKVVFRIPFGHPATPAPAQVEIHGASALSPTHWHLHVPGPGAPGHASTEEMLTNPAKLIRGDTLARLP